MAALAPRGSVPPSEAQNQPGRAGEGRKRRARRRPLAPTQNNTALVTSSAHAFDGDDQIVARNRPNNAKTVPGTTDFAALAFASPSSAAAGLGEATLSLASPSSAGAGLAEAV